MGEHRVCIAGVMGSSPLFSTLEFDYYFNYMVEKKCIYCEEVKCKDKFPKHSLYKDRLDTRCKDCIKKHSTIRRELKKNAPPRPELCECCNKIPIKWVLDHDHKTNKFRGWICDRCNTGLGKLGDDLEGLIKAVKYLNKQN